MTKKNISTLRGCSFAALLAFSAALFAQTFTEYKSGITQDLYPQELSRIVVGPNGNLWFLKTEGNIWSWGQMTAQGVAVSFRGAENDNTFYRPYSAVAAPDGNLWFAGGGLISKITPAGQLTSYGSGVVPQGSGPTAITVGPDGNLWVTLQQSDSIGRITWQGVFTEFKAGISSGSKPIEIVAGPDGNLWFTEYYGFRIGRLTPAGVVTEFPVGPFPTFLVNGTDGRMWYVTGEFSNNNTVYESSSVYRLNTSGQSEFVARLPAGDSNRPYSAAAGPDGNLWLAAAAGNKIFRVATNKVVTEFTAGISAGASPVSITSGPDGNLWFSEAKGGRIARLSTSGQISEFTTGPSVVTRPASPTRATLGPDGNVWFTMSGNQKIGRITPAGLITEFSQGFGANTYPFGIATGADGNLWFTNFPRLSAVGTVGRITLAGQVTEFEPSPDGPKQPVSIVAGSDNNLWFTTSQSGLVSRLTTGGQVTEFKAALPPTYWSGDSDIASGPDGNIWYTKNANVMNLVRVTPSGTTTEFPTGSTFLYGINAGADGNMWFGSYGSGGYRFSKLTMSGTVTNFPAFLPPVSGSPNSPSFPYRGQMTLGPDGNIWAHLSNSADGGERLARVAKSGVVTYFTPRISPSARISDITVGADGNLWLPLKGSDSIAKMTLPPEVVTSSSKASTLLVRDRSKLLSVQWVNNRIQFNSQTNSNPATRVVANIDLNRDGIPDLVFQDLSGSGEQGEVRAWTNGLPSSEKVLRSVKKVWDVQAVGDLDGDGFGDIVWRYMPLGSFDTGVSYVWFTNGTGVSQVRKRGGAPLDWTLLGVMDLNGDGADDMVYVSPEGQIRVLMATANRTCANLSVTASLPAGGAIPLTLGNFVPQLAPGAILYQTKPGEYGLLSLDARNAVLPPPTGNPDDPNASCTATSATVAGRIFPLPNLQYYPSFYGAVDLNGDGITDVIWRNPDGTLQVQLFPNSIFVPNPVIAPNSYVNVGTAPE